MPGTMRGLVSGRKRATSNASARSSVESEAGDSDTLVVEPDQGNVLTHIISQLRPGADLSRVVLPTFILEPRSMLERITNFMCHPEMLLPIPEIEDPVERFLGVVKFYLSGWHIRPPGVKKPLNPVLGEIYTCYWDLPGGKRAYYVSEQTSHHPPKSSYFYMVPEHHIRVDGTLKPRSKFLGNSAASMMEGVAVLSLLNRGKDRNRGEKYILTQPNMYARGILFGNMKYELGDHSFIRCPELGLTADVEFKTKGWVSGTYNAIGGYIRNERTGENLYELSGLWSEEMYLKDLRTGHKEMFFNAQRAKASKPKVRPVEEQEERESVRLWYKTAQAVKAKDHETATDEKTKIEDRQRDEAARRAQEGVEWHPRLFRRVKGGPGGPEEGEEDLEWIINARIDGDTPEKKTEQIMAIYPIIKGQKSSEKNQIPRHPSYVGADLIDISDRPAESASNERSVQGQTPQPAAPSHVSTSQPHQLHAQNQPVSDTPKRDSKHQGEIEGLLNSTGKPAPEGPLIDFTNDVKKNLPDSTPAKQGPNSTTILPAETPGRTPGLNRSETEESNDVFVDATS